VKDFLGRAQFRAGEFIFRRAPGYRDRLLSFWTEGGTKLGPLERWLFAGLSRAIDRRYYDAAASTAEREAIKGLCMAGSSAVKWARHYLSLGFPDRYTHALKMFDEIESLLASGTMQVVRQVACCSGREIAYFATRYPQVNFVGSDCDQVLVDFLREQWKHLSNLTFDLVRLEEVQQADGAGLKCDLLYASGGFHYLDPVSLRGFLRRVQRLAGRLLLSQPMSRSYAVEKERDSQPRGQLSWNHPYPAFLREAGWTNVRLIEGLVQELPQLKNVAVFAESASASSRTVPSSSSNSNSSSIFVG
jgi:Methyltransferase domain